MTERRGDAERKTRSKERVDFKGKTKERATIETLSAFVKSRPKNCYDTDISTLTHKMIDPLGFGH